MNKIEKEINALMPNLVQCYKNAWEGNKAELDKLGPVTTVKLETYRTVKPGLKFGERNRFDTHYRVRMTGLGFGTDLTPDQALVLAQLLTRAAREIPMVEEKRKEISRKYSEIEKKKQEALSKLSDDEKILLGLKSKAKTTTAYSVLTKEIKAYFYDRGYDITFRNREGKHYIQLKINHKYHTAPQWYGTACNLVKEKFPNSHNTSASESELTFRIN